MKALIKWAGGKSWLRDGYSHMLPEPSTIKGYAEPFLGSAAVAQHYIGDVPCVLSDRNARLMAMYRGVRDQPDLVISELRGLTYASGEFAHVRRLFNLVQTTADYLIAAWFIYLNRTCFNGLYRENQRGDFNVPFGRYANPVICDEEIIMAWSEALSTGVDLSARDYLRTMDAALPGWFVFIDPPYVPASKSSNFTAYQAGGFGAQDQERLVTALHDLDRRGVRWMLTNADTACHLYLKWNISRVQVNRSVGAKTRGKAGEIIVTNYDVSEMRAAA